MLDLLISECLNSINAGQHRPQHRPKGRHSLTVSDLRGGISERTQRALEIFRPMPAMELAALNTFERAKPCKPPELDAEHERLNVGQVGKPRRCAWWRLKQSKTQ